jgi:arsenite methyltransferase
VSTKAWPVRYLAAQLRKPSGLAGLLVARRLNRNNREMVRAAVEASGAAPGARVADVGFGGGSGLALLLDRVSPGGQVIGVEASRTMLARARVLFRRPIARGSLTVQPGLAAALPLASATLDAVITVNTVYFLPDLEPAFRECARVLRRGGRLVVCLGDPEEMAEVPVTAHGFLLRPVPEVQAALAAAGLSLDEHRQAGQHPTTFHVLTASHP